MPIFEYKCDKCGHVTDFLESASAKGKHPCEKCGAADTQKLLSGFAVGRSTASGPNCESCPSGPCPSEMCGGGMCGMN